MYNPDLLDEYTEMDCMIHENMDNMSIWAAPHCKEPYFPVLKVYVGDFHYNFCHTACLDESKMCRIRMDKPEYVGLEDEDLILTKEQKERFIKEVTENWDVCIDMMNDAAYLQCCPDRNFMSVDSPIPDYSQLPTID